MRAFQNIGASKYRRSTGQEMKPGEKWVADEKESTRLDYSGALGIRVIEIPLPQEEAETRETDLTGSGERINEQVTAQSGQDDRRTVNNPAALAERSGKRRKKKKHKRSRDIDLRNP